MFIAQKTMLYHVILQTTLSTKHQHVQMPKIGRTITYCYPTNLQLLLIRKTTMFVG